MATRDTGPFEASGIRVTNPFMDMRRHSEQDSAEAEAAIAEIMELRKEFAGVFKGENVKALIEEGRM